MRLLAQSKHGKISGDEKRPNRYSNRTSRCRFHTSKKRRYKNDKGNRENFFKLFHNEFVKATRSNMPIEEFMKNYDRKDTNYIESNT